MMSERLKDVRGNHMAKASIEGAKGTYIRNNKVFHSQKQLENNRKIEVGISLGIRKY